VKPKETTIVIISLVIFIALFIFINPEEFLLDLISFNPMILVLIMSLFVVDIFLRVFRWWMILHSQELENPVPFTALINPTFSSSLLNLILPGRLGELVRLYNLRDQHNVRYSVGLSVIVVEQVINMMSLILVGSVGLGLLIISGTELNNDFISGLIPYAFFGSLIMLAGIIILFIVDPKIFIPLFRFLPEKIFIKIERLIKTFSFGLQTIKGKFYIFWIALFSSFAVWILEGIIIWLIAIEFISVNFEFPIALFASILGNLNFMFPILPGAVLQYEFFIAYILQLSQFWIGEKAVSVALFDRIIKTSVLLFIGGYATIKIGYTKISDWREEKPDLDSIN